MPTKPTPLALVLKDEGAETRATPLDAFKIARQRWWHEGERLNLCAIADELGVSRATLTRWVGNKELLLGEILWSLYSKTVAKIRVEAQAAGRGADSLMRIYRDMNREIIESKRMRQFLSEDPQLALKVLTSNSPLHQRVINYWKTLLDEEIAAGYLAPPQMDTESLAYFIIRIGEGCVYSDLICGRKPELEPADKAVRLLLAPRQ
jgi:AcrR family transcriptional regulator